MDVARIEVPRVASAPRRPHFLAGAVEVVTMMNSIAL
jgi:hypothetical protein